METNSLVRTKNLTFYVVTGAKRERKNAVEQFAIRLTIYHWLAEILNINRNNDKKKHPFIYFRQLLKTTDCF